MKVHMKTNVLKLKTVGNGWKWVWRIKFENENRVFTVFQNNFD